jgi:hypothetical protein
MMTRAVPAASPETSVAPNLVARAAAGPAPVDLRSAAHFAILAASEISSTGGGIVEGDVGLSPTTGAAITGLTTNRVTGIIYAVNAAGPTGSVMDPGLLVTAKVDLVTAYDDAAGRTPPDFVDPGSGNIGGMTLAPGLYKFTSSASITGSDVTLEGGANDVWIFQIGSTLTGGADGRKVILAGGAQARNIFWQVGTSATLGTGCEFKGTLMAKVSITMDVGSTMEGRALASTGAVTFNAASNSLPQPEAPRFTHIFATTNDAVTVILSTTPFLFLTLETCPDLLRTNWTTLTTDTPVSTPWTFTDETVINVLSQRFYRAFLSPNR